MKRTRIIRVEILNKMTPEKVLFSFILITAID